MTILLKRKEKDVLFVNVQRTKKHQLNEVFALRSFVMNILLKVFFVTIAANKKCHSSNFFYCVEYENSIFPQESIPKYKKIFYENIYCQYST